jgi:hypothetical protein
MILKYVTNITNWILAWFREVFDREVSLALAGVHTTLIAVLVACMSAYILFAYNTVQQAELKAIEEAEKINSIMFLVHQCPYGMVEITEVFDKEKLIDMMYNVTHGLDDQSLPQDVDGKAQKAFGIMNALVSQYPFPTLQFKTKEGRFAARSDAEPMSFANLNEVRTWVGSMRQSTRVFLMEFIGTGRLLPLFKEFSKSEHVSKFKDTAMKSPILRSMVSRKLVPGFGTHVTWESLDPLSVYYDFLNRIAEAMSIVKSTQIYVKRAEQLGSGYPSKLRLGIVLFLVALGFGFGVVYPLAAAKVRRAFALWLPLFIYVLIGVLALGIIL